MQAIGLTPDATVEIISAYTATNQPIPGVASPPGWFVVGAFFLPLNVDEAQLEVVGSMSDPSLTMNVRLFDMTEAAPVSGTDATLAATVDSRATSGVFALSGQRVYQMQAQVIGGAGDSFFGVVKSATLI